MWNMIWSPWVKPGFLGGVALVVMMPTPIELPTGWSIAQIPENDLAPSPTWQHLAAVVGWKKKTQVVSIYLYACELHALSQMQLREVSMMGIFFMSAQVKTHQEIVAGLEGILKGSADGS